MTCYIRIGTSGFHYKHWKGAFYQKKTPPTKLLDFYVQQFDSVELNNSFYRLPPASAFECWREAQSGELCVCSKSQPLHHSQQEVKRSGERYR
jgi:uncharacterized protein YecE (DUF72 family)